MSKETDKLIDEVIYQAQQIISCYEWQFDASINVKALEEKKEELKAKISELEQIKQEHESELIAKTVELEEAQELIAELEKENKDIRGDFGLEIMRKESEE